MRGADENPHRFIVQRHILDVSACTAGETLIFDSGNGLANAELFHENCL
jgi:hypothetical protein